LQATVHCTPERADKYIAGIDGRLETFQLLLTGNTVKIARKGPAATHKIEPILSPESVEKIKSVIEQLENKKPEIVELCDPERVDKYIAFINDRIEVFQWLLTGDAAQLKIFKPKKAE